METTDQVRSRQRYLRQDHAAGYHTERRPECLKCQEQSGSLTAEEQATLLDIVRQYHAGTQPASVTMSWVYGLVANSALNDRSL